jgi:hypothetical protein
MINIPPKPKASYLAKIGLPFAFIFSIFSFNMIDFNFSDFQNNLQNRKIVTERYLIQNGNGHGIILLQHC